ncbi:glycosyl hydrolase family 61-domain-containing protein [Phyllosticta capitalensis]
MKFSLPTLLATAALIHSSAAHYCFNRLIVNGNITSEYEYVRKNNNSNSPVTNVNSTDLRCNAGGLLTGSTTKTHSVKAGDTVGFALDTGIGHPGPVQVYMSKADSTAKSYDGAGEWFKIYELGTSDITDDGLQWATNDITNFTFALPQKLPKGEYLLRVESIALHGASTYGGAQFYISCAQLSVESDATTAAPAGDFVAKIPGVYTGNEPGIMLNIYYPVPTNYTMPGPAIWPSGSAAHSAVFVGESAAASTAASTPSSAATSAVNVAAVTPVNTPANTPVFSAPAYSAPAAYSTPAAYSSYYAPAYTPGATPAATPGASSSGGAVGVYGQCGGSNYQGSTTCVSGATCQRWNDYYSQCVASAAAAAA